MIPGKVTLLLLSALLCASVHAREGNTLTDELRIFTEEISVQCSSVKEQLEGFRVRADPLTGYNLKDAVQSLCVCMPARIQELMATLSAEDLARALTPEEFLNLFNPAVIDKCAAEQLQAMYGEQCRKRFRKAGVDTAKYCPCMQDVVNGYSDAMARQIAAAAADYLPMAAAAEQQGQPVPPRPPVLESYFQADQGCKRNRNASAEKR